MKYYKNTELARLYNVSEKSVRNWIEAANAGRLELQLLKENGRTRVANTSKNTLIIEELVQKGKKYRNSRGYKVLRPSAAFYNVYNPRQVLDVIANLDVYREFPHQYAFLDGGAHYWDQLTQKLLRENNNSLTNSIQVLELTTDYITTLLEDYDKVNIIDIGVGNCLEIRPLLEHLHHKRILQRYIGIDISKDMLAIAQRNLNAWFKGDISFEGHVRDIKFERFNDLLAEDAFRSEPRTINVVTFMGGTLSNLREPGLALSTIRSSMGKDDLFIMSRKIDTVKSRRHFDFSVTAENIGHDFRDFALELLNINPSFYALEQFYDDQSRERRRQIRLKVALALEFELNGRRKVIELNKGESVLLWRAAHLNYTEVVQQLDTNGFQVLQATQSKDSAQAYMQTICRVKGQQLSE